MLAAQTVVDLVAAAVAGAALVASSTFTDRAWPLAAGELPAALVIAGPEPIEPATVHGLQLHELEVLVRLRCQALSALDDAMHALTAQVLTAVYAPGATAARVSAGVKSFRTVRLDRDMESTGEAKVGAVDITFLAAFYTQASAPETILN